MPPRVVRILPVGYLYGAAFAPDGARLAIATNDGAVYVVTLGDPPTPSRLETGLSPLYCVAWSPGGGRIAAGDEGGWLHVWRGSTATDGELELVIDGAHPAPIRGVAFASNQLLATCAWDGALRLWDLAAPEGTWQRAERQVASEAHALACSPDGRLIAVGGEEGVVRLLRTSALAAAYDLGGHGDAVHALAFSPSGARVVSGSWDGTARVWYLADRREVARLEHGGGVQSVACSPTRRLVATGGDDCCVRLWDPDSGDALGVLEGHEEQVTGLAFSPDGRLLVSAAWDGTLRLWPMQG